MGFSLFPRAPVQLCHDGNSIGEIIGIVLGDVGDAIANHLNDLENNPNGNLENFRALKKVNREKNQRIRQGQRFTFMS